MRSIGKYCPQLRIDFIQILIPEVSMIRKRRLIVNTALLTGSSLLMSCIGMAFQVWLVGRIGEAGIGLYQLVLSVSFLCATVAISGIRFAATRLISEELGRENPGGVRGAMLARGRDRNRGVIRCFKTSTTSSRRIRRRQYRACGHPRRRSIRHSPSAAAHCCWR